MSAMNENSTKPGAAAPGRDDQTMVLRARGFEFHFPRPPMVMGILNVTPDSFSDGGRFLDPVAAVDRALGREAQGADIIDIGGESTRPNAIPVPEAEELRRVVPVLEKLAGVLKVPVSIDTVKPRVARAALELGAAIVNDVAASRMTSEMWDLVAETRAGYVVMHMQGDPQTMQAQPRYADVVEEVSAFFADRLARLAASGVAVESIILDVGIGFGKTAGHNLRLLAALEKFKKWRRPMLLGLSRKSFIGAVAGGAAAEQRLPGSLAAACWAAACGAQILRVHDVAETRQALAVTSAILAADRA
jgi:dihydropteroate synthase